MDEILDITELSLSEVWKHEAFDFTPWLASEAQRLSEALGLDLVLVDTEVPVGPFFADIVFRDQSTDSVVVVENMLGATDHDHLGKMITYAAGLQASHAVLVAREFRPEHRSALHWLNDAAQDTSFFGIEVSVIRIGDSSPAAQLKVVVEPDDWSRQVKPQLSATQRNYQGFWAALYPSLHERYPNWSNAKKPQPQNWLNLPSGASGVAYYIKFSWPSGSEGYQLETGLYIEPSVQGSADAVFDTLLELRPDIEDRFGGELDWVRPEDTLHRRIGILSGSIVDPADRDSWPSSIDWLLDHVGRVREALGPALAGTK